MQYTNKLNLPQYISDWLQFDSYDYSDDPHTLGATTLMKPIQAYWLTVRHADSFQIDVSDLVAAKFGTAIHDSIEQISTPNTSKEQRVQRIFSLGDVPYTIAGRYDVLVSKDGRWTIRDIKTTSVWAYIFGGKDAEYQKQLSIYRWLLSASMAVEQVGYIDFFFTDWQSSKAKQDKDYPQHRILPSYKVDLFSLDETEKYIHSRLSLLAKYEFISDDQLPPCTDDELWTTNEVFAVTRPSAKKATKLCSTRDEAVQYIKDKRIQASIELRPSKAKRCKYCPCYGLCKQGQDLKKQGRIIF